MRWTLVKLTLSAAVIALAWVVRGGFGDVDGALREAGWPALAAVTLWHLLPMAVCGTAWRVLVPPEGGDVSGPARPAPSPRLGLFVLARWVRDGVGDLLAVLPLGGEVAAARLLTRHGVAGSLAAALVVVDVTAEVLAQVGFCLIGVGLWLARHPWGEVGRWSTLGIALTLPLLGGIAVVQRRGVIGLLATLPGRFLPAAWRPTAPEGRGVAHHVAAIYGQRRRFGASVGLHLTAWVLGAGEAWLALGFLGHPLALADVVAMESVIFALRSAAFVVPAGLGVQEGGYVLIGAALGLPPDVALAVSLLKRGRELGMGLSGLGLWQAMDRRRSG